MTISTVATDDPVKASTQNSVIANVNGSPGRAVFKVNDIWTVPAGVHRFKVYLTGGGGARGADYEYGEGNHRYGGQGGDSPLCSKIFGGYDIGTSFNITIGAGSVVAGGTGGTSTFGTVLQSTGGGGGENGIEESPMPGSRGTHNGQLAHDNGMFLAPEVKGFGSGAIVYNVAPFVDVDKPASDGICVIEW